MRPKTLRPCLEVLEDRLTPTLTYILDAAGNLSVLGQTSNAVMTITEAPGNSVTVMDGAASKTFAVTGNLNVNVQSLNALFLLTYNVGGNVLGSVNLSARSLGSVDLFVNGTAASTIGGSLTLKTAAGNDLVGVNAFGGGSALTVGGSLSINTGAGSDLVSLGGTGNLSVNGNLFAYNVNTLLFGAPAVTVGGLTNITTDANAGANLVSTDPTTVMAGDLFVTGGPTANTVLLNGTVAGRAFVNLGGGASSLFTSANSIIADSLFILGGNGGDNVVLAGTVAGSVTATLGNGNNTFVLAVGSVVAGPSISYYGGNGVDSVTFSGTALDAHLTAFLGNGDDAFTLTSDSLDSAYLNGGFGNNTFTSTVTVTFPLTLVNFV